MRSLFQRLIRRLTQPKFHFVNVKFQSFLIRDRTLMEKFLALEVIGEFDQTIGFVSDPHFYGSLYIPSTDQTFTLQLDGEVCYRFEYYEEWDGNPHYKNQDQIDHTAWLELLAEFIAHKLK